MGDAFNEMYWEMGQKSFQGFVKHLSNLKAASLNLTQQVMSERDRLECLVDAISQKIQEALVMLETIRQEIEVTYRYKGQLEANKDFTYTVREDSSKVRDLPQGTYVTNCLVCNHPCHYNCAFANDDE